eukprot:COSAG02_NODE_2593_length_8463_cov_4.133309_7_plen_157_part_00
MHRGVPARGDGRVLPSKAHQDQHHAARGTKPAAAGAHACMMLARARARARARRGVNVGGAWVTMMEDRRRTRRRRASAAAVWVALLHLVGAVDAGWNMTDSNTCETHPGMRKQAMIVACAIVVCDCRVHWTACGRPEAAALVDNRFVPCLPLTDLH